MVQHFLCQQTITVKCWDFFCIITKSIHRSVEIDVKIILTAQDISSWRREGSSTRPGPHCIAWPRLGKSTPAIYIRATVQCNWYSYKYKAEPFQELPDKMNTFITRILICRQKRDVRMTREHRGCLAWTSSRTQHLKQWTTPVGHTGMYMYRRIQYNCKSLFWK